MFFEFHPMSEEDRQRIMDQNAASATEGYLRLHNFLESLDPDQLEVLQIMIHGAMSHQGYGAHTIGEIGGYMRHKHKICECGSEPKHKPSDHDDATFIINKGAPPARDSVVLPEPIVVSTAHAAFVKEAGPTPAEEAAAIADYGMVPDPSPENPQRVRCKGCSVQYISMDDRMLRPPGVDGCSGCQQAAAHGGGANPWD